MSPNLGSLQELANPGSEFTWATYAFAGNDPLEAVLEPGYFARWGHRLRDGDLILWGCGPDRTGKTRMGYNVPIRPALLMVVDADKLRPVVRLVQDWGGCIEDDRQSTRMALVGAAADGRRGSLSPGHQRR